MHPRRKWSDWSECSAQCKKTRHRLYCDDILAPQNRSSKLSVREQVEAEIKRPTRLDGGIVKRDAGGIDKQSGRRRRHSHLPDAQSNNDDDDYADEGDEEGEYPDSCDKVEASKTFQEINCRGGQCRLPFVDAATAAALPIRLKQLTNRPEQELLFRQQQHQRLAPLWPQLSSGPVDMAAIQQLTTNQAAARLPTGHAANVSSPANSPSEGASSGTDSSSLRASLPVPVSTRHTGNLWAQQLFNSELGPQANLIQWSILIGALLSVVLLIMLTLRKLLVPSYHWMLAKQTLKSSGHSCGGGGLEECSHHNCYSTSTSTTCPTLIPPTNSRKHPRNNMRRPAQIRPHMVNSSGQAQLIKSDLLEFNTDHMDAHQPKPMPLHSTGGRAQVDDTRGSCKERRSFGELASTSQPENGTSYQAGYRYTSPTTTQQAAVHVFQNKSYACNQWLGSPVNQGDSVSSKPVSTNDKSSSSISSTASASDSPSIQSTTAQLISNAASSSFEHSQDSLAHLTNQSVDNSPARPMAVHGAIANRAPLLKSIQLGITKSHQNSPLQTKPANHFTPKRHFISNGRLTSFSGGQQSGSRLKDCIADSEYTQPIQEPEPPKTDQESLQLLNQNNSCEITERHFYEEIVHHRKW